MTDHCPSPSQPSSVPVTVGDIYKYNFFAHWHPAAVPVIAGRTSESQYLCQVQPTVIFTLTARLRDSESGLVQAMTESTRHENGRSAASAPGRGRRSYFEAARSGAVAHCQWHDPLKRQSSASGSIWQPGSRSESESPRRPGEP